MADMTDAEIIMLANALVGELDDAGADADDKICICSAAIALALREIPKELRYRRLIAHVDAQLEGLDCPDEPRPMLAPSAMVH